ncbi:MAG: GNAT family N-acetyltransferase, partial [Pseudomonadota bacterium]|nr:GNAT family N-acetyltransferase [Pseudomonadota bacterium]
MGDREIEVALADEAERGLIGGLAQFYIYDFSELEPLDSGDFEPGTDGRFEPIPHMDSYWRDDGRFALLIRRGGRPVGFALINAIAHSGLHVDHNMAEFFVMRKHRRAGVASAAVRAILTRWPGRWEIAVAARNTGARAFW